LQMPALNPQAMESVQAFMARVARMDVGLCPVCKVGHLRTVEVLAGARQLPAPVAMVWPQERGGHRERATKGWNQQVVCTSAAKLAGKELRVASAKPCLGFKSWAVWYSCGSFFVRAQGGWLTDFGGCPAMI
jgi:hypothetical protein